MPTAPAAVTDCTCQTELWDPQWGSPGPAEWCPACQGDYEAWLLESEAESAIESETYELSALNVAMLETLIVRELKGAIA